jgi:hypothetical protein
LPVVLCGCETWSLALREEFNLRVFENRALRRIFGPKREATGGWRKLRKEELSYKRKAERKRKGITGETCFPKEAMNRNVPREDMGRQKEVERVVNEVETG